MCLSDTTIYFHVISKHTRSFITPQHPGLALFWLPALISCLPIGRVSELLVARSACKF